MNPFNDTGNPYINEQGELIVPVFTPPQYRFWAGGQSILETLAELAAPSPVWERYGHRADLSEDVHRGYCQGVAKRIGEIEYCGKCGRFATAGLCTKSP